MRKIVFWGSLVLCLLLATCSKKSDNIVGTVDQVEITEPQILADGLSTTVIMATILDEDGKIAPGYRVEFTTTHGTISEYAISSEEGIAVATLQSVASEEDIDAVVTATVVDTASGLYKRQAANMSVRLEVPGFTSPNKGLKKTTSQELNSAQIDITFLGVTVAPSFDVDVLPADGLSKAQVKVSVKETTSKKAVSNAALSLAATFGTVENRILTDGKGVATAELIASSQAGVDTILVEYGQVITKTLVMKYVMPGLTLVPKEAMLLADGKSKKTFVASLLTPQNTPIVDAEITFSTTNGTVSPSKVTTNNEGKAEVQLTSAAVLDSIVQVVARFHELADTARARFVASTSERGLTFDGVDELYRDGISKTELTATILDENNNPVKGATVQFTCLYGSVSGTAITNENGHAAVLYIPDVGEADVTDQITASIGSASTVHEIDLLGMQMEMLANPDSIPADGATTALISVHLKLSSSQKAVSGVVVEFYADKGYIATSAATSEEGIAALPLRAGIDPGQATVTAKYGGFTKTQQVEFYVNSPQSIILTATPNFIWVKETGNLEQTNITATVLGVQGEAIGHEVLVKFYLQNGPGGGEGFVVADGAPASESEPIKTVAGQATIGFRAGIRSGTAEIRAEVLGELQVIARTTNIVIRSGPPYIWVDPNDPNNVETHMTVTFDYFNLFGWGYVREFNVGVYIGDKYNNPVEKGTTVYLTSTAGIITTDITTNERGEGSAVLLSANPRPYLLPQDGSTLAPHRIPNPNDPSVYLPIMIPDFEGNEVMNSLGNTGENDGVAVVLATTQGRDQNGRDAKVFDTNMAVFSGGIARFDVSVMNDVTSLKLGQTAVIVIRIYDINGNPPGAGSTLKAKTSAGELSGTDLMSERDDYGYGSTAFTTVLVNNLDPLKDKPQTAEVEIEFSGNASKLSRSVYIDLLLEY
jgi:hypothetical protein